MVLYAHNMDIKSQKNICYCVKIGDEWYWKYTVPSLRRYCEKHNIEFRVWNKLDNVYATKKYPKKNMKFWLQRFAIINEFAESEYDNVLMVDLDMFFNQDAPNIFNLVKKDSVYQQYAPNVMKNAGFGTRDWDGIEYGNGGLYLMNKNVAKKLVPEITSEKIYSTCDQKNFAWARLRAGIPFIKIEDRWNYTIWSLNKENLIEKFIKNEIYFIHYGSNNSKVLKEHLRSFEFSSKAFGYKNNKESDNLIPRKIWMLWLQGIEKAPPVVLECYKSWKNLNPGWEINILDEKNINNFIDTNLFEDKKIPPQPLSDIIRIILLEKYGGVWVDASVFCTKPLNEWVFEYAKNGFFAFEKPGYDRTISSWFIASEFKSPVISFWHNEVASFWQNAPITGKYLTKVYRKLTTILIEIKLAFLVKSLLKPLKKTFGFFPYFWFHYLFDVAIENNTDAKLIWQTTKQISANGPHTLSFYGIESSPSQIIKNFIISNQTPLHKLSWRIEIKDESTIDFLIKENKKKYNY